MNIIDKIDNVRRLADALAARGQTDFSFATGRPTPIARDALENVERDARMIIAAAHAVVKHARSAQRQRDKRIERELATDWSGDRKPTPDDPMVPIGNRR